MKILHLTLCFCFVFSTFAWADDASEPRTDALQKVAILPFLNQASEQLEPFVNTIPLMLAIHLSQSKKLTPIEQAEIKKVLASSPSLSEIPRDETAENRLSELGKQLGADILIAGSFIEVEGLQHRIEAQIYDARSGKLLSKHTAVDDNTQGIALVNKLAEDLSNALVGSKIEQAPLKRIAVLYFKNELSADYHAFVATIPTMLMSVLAQFTGVVLIEQTQVQEYLKSFHLEENGVLDTEKAIQLGEKLNADVLVLGSFSMSEGIYELTGVSVDAKTGKIVDQQSVKGDEKEIILLPSQLGEKLKAAWTEKRIIDLLAMGKLEIQFQISFKAMTERPRHFQSCKLFVDGKYIETSKPVKTLNTWVKLFSTQLQAGEHDIEILHGYVEKDGSWLKPFYMQPKKWHVRITPNAPTRIRYEFHVGWAKDEFIYHRD